MGEVTTLCVRQFKAEWLQDDLFAGAPDTIFIKYLVGESSELQGLLGILVIDISCCTHARSNRGGNLCESAFRYQEFGE